MVIFLLNKTYHDLLYLHGPEKLKLKEHTQLVSCFRNYMWINVIQDVIQNAIYP